MNNDLERLRQLLGSWQVPYRIDENGDVLVGRFWDETEDRGNPKVIGYRGFYTCFVFNDDGDFVQMGAFE